MNESTTRPNGTSAPMAEDELGTSRRRSERLGQAWRKDAAPVAAKAARHRPADPSHGSADERGSLKISAVARLSGISAHTLRKWEVRYGAVAPGRTKGGKRVYTYGDLQRLQLIKQLADSGLSLREVAQMSLEELTHALSLLGTTPATSCTTTRDAVRVAVLGQATATALARHATASLQLEVVGGADSPDAFDARLGAERVDILICECPAVRGETRGTVRALMKRLGARGAIVTYRFAARGNLLALRAPDVLTLRAPVEPAVLERAAVGLIHPDSAEHAGWPRPTYGVGIDADVPAPQLSLQALARLASTASTIRCECPHHLAEIVMSLRAFEDYSAECENRSPEDAALHRYLWRSTAQARALFEEAIERVADAEGIDLDE